MTALFELEIAVTALVTLSLHIVLHFKIQFTLQLFVQFLDFQLVPQNLLTNFLFKTRFYFFQLLLPFVPFTLTLNLLEAEILCQIHQQLRMSIRYLHLRQSILLVVLVNHLKLIFTLKRSGTLY